MKNFFYISTTVVFVFFCFIVLLKGLNNNNTYVPDKIFEKQILNFTAKNLSDNKEIDSEELFLDNKIYLLNIWASWCLPCRAEHDILMKLSRINSIKIIGLNYKDNLVNAEKFINEMGNPYSEILIDKDGVISIELGAYGIPETFIINNKMILKKFIGPLNEVSLKEIMVLLK